MSAGSFASPLRIFLFGTRGYMSVVLDRLIDDARVSIVGLCGARPPGVSMRARAAAGAVQRRLRIRGRHDVIVTDPFGDCIDPWTLASRRGIACHPLGSVKTEEFAKCVRDARPDILLVAGFPRLIPASVIDLPERIGINLHPSLLPRHRGGTPNRWVIRNGELETGVTAHVLDEHFDTGDILGQWPVELDPGMSWGDAESRILARLPEVVDTLVDQSVNDRLNRTPQNPDAGEYEPPFHGRHAWIDWSDTAAGIVQTCLATRPKTGALTRIGGKPQCIWSVVPVDPPVDPATPGAVLSLDATGRPVVSCGRDEAVTIEQVVAYGAVRDARGWRDVAPGMRFEPAPGPDE
jgi:methionyl-tRNA formyltransferase